VIKGKNPFKQSENLPIIEVIGESTECTVRWTGKMFNNTFNIQLIITDSLTRYIKTNSIVTFENFYDTFVDRIEARTNSVPVNTSILWILQDNLRLSNSCQLINDFSISYEPLESETSYFLKAEIQFKANLISY
jgi:hypothetical protein